MTRFTLSRTVAAIVALLVIAGCSSNTSSDKKAAPGTAPASSTASSSVTTSSSVTPAASPHKHSCTGQQPSVTMTQVPHTVIDGKKGFTFKGTARCLGDEGLLLFDRDAEGRLYVTDEAIRTTPGSSRLDFAVTDVPIGSPGDKNAKYEVVIVTGPVAGLKKLIHKPANDDGDVVLTGWDLTRAGAMAAPPIAFRSTYKR